MTPRAARLPTDDVADSYEGPVTVASCVECGHVAYVPRDVTNGVKGHCPGCKQIVGWSV